MKKILVLGATSGIAQACVRLYAARGASLYLVGRNAQNLDAVTRDAATRGAARAEQEVLDLDDLGAHAGLVARAEAALGGLDGVLLAHGVLGDQAACERDFSAANAVLTTNLVGPLSLLTLLANRFEAQRAGTLVVLSSVAGDRGRQSNYVYGTTKGALSVFLQGLRNRLSRSGVAVVTVKPGFVDTAMTAGVKKNALFATPEQVARGIVRAADRGADVVYLPGFWRLIMFIIRCVPERLFKRLKL
jgi:short-subunit dehydrogenase